MMVAQRLMVIFAIAWTSVATCEPVIVRVQESHLVRPVSMRMLGVNQNWYWANLWAIDPMTHELSKEFMDTARSVFVPLARMSGSSAQKYRWKKALGPWGLRQPQKVRPQDQQRRFGMGPVEWVEMNRRINPNVEFTWTLNLTQETCKDHADLAEFMTGSGDINPNGGVNWARKRIDGGCPKSVPIVIWELGSEVDRSMSYEEYLSKCRAAIDAIRQVQPDAVFAALANTAPWNKKKRVFEDWREWHRRVLHDIGDDLDFLTFHPYYYGMSVPRMMEYIDHIGADIRRITGSDRIKIYISEHARWPDRDERGRLISDQTHSLEGCLATSEFVNIMFQNPMVTAMAYHNFSGGKWHLVRINQDGFHRTAIADLFDLYRMGLLRNVVKAKASGVGCDMQYDSNLTFTVLATKAEGRLSLILTNRSEHMAREVRLYFETPKSLLKHLVFTADDIDAVNTADARPVRVCNVPVDRRQPVDSFRILPHSVTVLMFGEYQTDEAR